MLRALTREMHTENPVILVADDDPAVRDSLKFSLELEGLVVHTCSGGIALLEHPELSRADCIVLDYKMPGMDGFEVLERLKERKLSVPIILITSSATAAIRARADRAGVRHLLEKPLLDTVLIDRIQEVTA